MWEKTAEFWVVRDAWEAAVVVAQKNRVKTRKMPPTLDGQRRKWTLGASKYLGSRPKILAQTQGISIQAPDVSGAAFRLIEDLPAKLADQMDEKLSAVVFKAFREWPVSSGFSKASLFLDFQPAGSSFTARIGDSAPYSPLIRGNPTRKLLGSPARAAASEAIQAALEGVGHG